MCLNESSRVLNNTKNNRLDASVCNNKQRWNNDKCRYEW